VKKKCPIDYSDPKIRKEILVRQRRGIWTPEQVEILAKHFRLKPGMKMLDAGCGFGYALRTWGPYCLPGGQLTGVDRDPSLLKTAERQTIKAGMGNFTAFVEGDIYDLPCDDNSFDITLCHVVFCHLKKPERALDELIRVTKRRGCVAVFDNAHTGPGEGWDNQRRPPLRQRVRDAEIGLRAREGRRRLGYGDFSVGCQMPSWMEERSLKDVDVRANERVRWIAPPYRSPAQRTELRNMRERLQENPWRSGRRRASDVMRAGGISELEIALCHRRSAGGRRRTRKVFENGKLAYAWSGQFWCIWGFKP